MGATPAAPVAAGVAFCWRSEPSRQPRLGKRLEPDALPQSARVIQAKRDGRRTRLQTTLRPDRGQLQASLDHDLPHVEPHAAAECPPTAVQHSELTRPERISGATLGDADRSGFEPVCVARPGCRGGCHHEKGRNDAQREQGGHPSRSKRACREHASSFPRGDPGARYIAHPGGPGRDPKAHSFRRKMLPPRGPGRLSARSGLPGRVEERDLQPHLVGGRPGPVVHLDPVATGLQVLDPHRLVGQAP
jgi:hypothetical protein